METKTPRPLCCVVSDFKFCWQPGSPIGSCHQAFISHFCFYFGVFGVFSFLPWSFFENFFFGHLWILVGPFCPCGCVAVKSIFPSLDPSSRVIAGQDWCYFTCFQIKLPVLLAHLLALVLHGLLSLHHVHPAFRGASTSYQ